jgi:5-methylcytosine-specific restriction endonuclease McrA
MTRDEHIKSFKMDLHVHHIVPQREFVEDTGQSIDDANEMDNLETLCATFHQENEVTN